MGDSMAPGSHSAAWVRPWGQGKGAHVSVDSLMKYHDGHPPEPVLSARRFYGVLPLGGGNVLSVSVPVVIKPPRFSGGWSP
jgi:hypothetical protein